MLGMGRYVCAQAAYCGLLFLMEGEEGITKDLYLLVHPKPNSVAGPLHRIGWNQQYILYTDDNRPTEWNVIAVKEHTTFAITDIQRMQDFRFKQIAIGSTSEAWPWAKH
jgi:hypothetical protein